MNNEQFDTVTVADLVTLLQGTKLFALFDVRDEGIFARSHMLFASSLPLSDLEARLYRLVPAREVLIVLTSDSGDGISTRAARRCSELGYRNVRLLEGGNQAWAQAGYRLFRGIHVPSKAFGELVESHYHTPMIEPEELHRLLQSGAPVAVFDSRPPHEFHRMSLPGARNCPGGDLLAGVAGCVPDENTLVVINCAGRTRSIIGAQSLITAGFPNRVVALKNGTMGWHLAGFDLEHGQAALVESPPPEQLRKAQILAERVRQQYAIPVASLAALRERMASDGALMLLDVRGPLEFERTHLAGSRNAPGGQLIQATDNYVALRNAPLVLIDDDGVRASVTASWLVQLGFRDVSVLAHEEAVAAFQRGGALSHVPPHLVPAVERISVDQVRSDIEAGTTLVVDISRSDTYYKGHIPGALFTIRSRWSVSVPRLPRRPSITLVAEDEVTGAFAAAELAALYGAPVRLLEGGSESWRAAGLSMARGLEDACDPPEDMWHIPSSPLGGGEAAMKDYLSWEVDLAKQVDREPGARFRLGSSVVPPAVDFEPTWVDTDEIFLRRWSPRSMSGEPLASGEVRALFEAARWAPSCNNSQPWRFVYALAGTAEWDSFFDVLSDGNKAWADRGALLAFILSTPTDQRSGKPLRSHAFDTGAAWQNIALQGQRLNLVVHGMLGFDPERARSVLRLPDQLQIQAMFVAGRPAAGEALPPALRAREVPNARLPLKVLAWEGSLPAELAGASAR
ncbi:rhodanese-like domain-containing protein [Hydrogenophaga sp. OTU3427]|uniref:rhodanese-like domain-containing protein n=1 Tax=Hydrogenophaga sp. OTU3427 TaxID=3043856 RepID=UPI00313A7902